jgi:uncharacterized protein
MFDFSKKLYPLAVILVLALLLSGIGTLLSGWQSFTGDYPRTVSVEATGEAYVSPDIATIVIGVTTEGEEVADVTVENTEKMNAVIEAIKALGVEEDDIKTNYYSLYPKYRWDEGEVPVEDGYTLNNQVKIKIRDFEKVSQVIEASTTKGANLINGLQFEVDDEEAAKAEARADAVAKVKEKAKSLEETTGVNLGKIVSFYEYSSGNYDYYGGKGGGVYAVSDEAMSSSIQPGQQEIKLTVTLEYQVK